MTEGQGNSETNGQRYRDKKKRWRDKQTQRQSGRKKEQRDRYIEGKIDRRTERLIHRGTKGQRDK